MDPAFGAFETAQTAYNVANELWKIAQGLDNYTQQTEMDGLHGQIESINTRDDTQDEKYQNDITDTLLPFKTDMLGTSIPNLDNKIIFGYFEKQKISKIP